MLEQYQLDFFQDNETSRLEAKLQKTQDSLDRVRKGTYARLNELQKKYDDMVADHELIKKMICNGGKDV